MTAPADTLVKVYRPRTTDTTTLEQLAEQPVQGSMPSEVVPEIGGRKEGLEPTRYGDWEKKGRCVDF